MDRPSAMVGVRDRYIAGGLRVWIGTVCIGWPIFLFKEVYGIHRRVANAS